MAPSKYAPVCTSSNLSSQMNKNSYPDQLFGVHNGSMELVSGRQRRSPKF